ncbi:MAG: DUF2934 domain-containing protein [Verrucomicrobia bacterium]|nr:DUF2934 domain-containing protein [Verrucomicrobiota bacterium]
MIPLHSASSHVEIERRAREIFERAGRPIGCDLDHWLQAEADYREGLRRNLANMPLAANRPVFPT